MKLIITVLALLLTSSFALANDFEFHALYEKKGFVTERMIPFQVKSKASTNYTIESVKVDKPCYGMVDIYRPTLVLIYCMAEVDTTFSIVIRRDGQLHEIKAPSMSVKKVALISSTPSDPTITYDSPGKKLFKLNECTKCHPAPNVIAKSANRNHLLNAFAGKPMRNTKTTQAMKQFDGFFSVSELDLLVKYINEEL